MAWCFLITSFAVTEDEGKKRIEESCSVDLLVYRNNKYRHIINTFITTRHEKQCLKQIMCNDCCYKVFTDQEINSGIIGLINAF